ncbi:GNAT family N-acetyltransferase [bacterium]|nr:GNAT family N-acetyltransferase [bacterium]
MNFEIFPYQGGHQEDEEMASLLFRVFVEEGYTDSATGESMVKPEALRNRGGILLARAKSGNLAGVIVYAPMLVQAGTPGSKAYGEIQLLAVDSNYRNQGIASGLIEAAESKIIALDYEKIIVTSGPTMTAAHRMYEQLGYRRNRDLDLVLPKDTSDFFYEKIVQKSNGVCQ